MISKYFIDKNGSRTKRIQGLAGGGHIEIAQTEEKLDPNSDVYEQMFKLGYIRCVETDTQIMVDAPKGLNRRQKSAVQNEAITAPGQPDKEIIINDRHVRESRTPKDKADQIVKELLST